MRCPTNRGGWSECAIRCALDSASANCASRICAGHERLGAQYFVHDERRYGHILDPRTGHPADAVLSTTVLAPTAAAADALSTAFYVLGPEGAQAYCAGHTEVAAIVLCPGPREGSIEHHTFGIEERDWVAGDGP